MKKVLQATLCMFLAVYMAIPSHAPLLGYAAFVRFGPGILGWIEDRYDERFRPLPCSCGDADFVTPPS